MAYHLFWLLKQIVCFSLVAEKEGEEGEGLGTGYLDYDLVDFKEDFDDIATILKLSDVYKDKLSFTVRPIWVDCLFPISVTPNNNGREGHYYKTTMTSDFILVVRLLFQYVANYWIKE